MRTTLEPTPETVSQAKNALERSTARLLHLLAFVPDDKLDWSPSPTSKSALRLVVHCARSDRFFAQVIPGTMPAAMPTAEAFFAGLHAFDPAIATRESAVALLQASTAELLAALETVTAETIEAPRNSPVGVLPTSFWVGVANEHRIAHTGQLEYLQTVWGDLDDHMA